MRTTRESITFDHPFSLTAVDKVQPAGTYAVDIDEELIEGLSFLAYRRVATTIYLPLIQGNPGSVQAVRVDPQELTAAHQETPPAWERQPTAFAENGIVNWVLSDMRMSTNMSAGSCWCSFERWNQAAAADEATLAALQALLARNDTDIAVLREIGLSIQWVLRVDMLSRSEAIMSGLQGQMTKRQPWPVGPCPFLVLTDRATELVVTEGKFPRGYDEARSSRPHEREHVVGLPHQFTSRPAQVNYKIPARNRLP